MRVGLPILLLIAISAEAQVASDADPLHEIFDYLEGKKFSVQIAIRLLDENELIVWDVEHSEVTVAGRALNVRLVGDDVVIDAFITPYDSADSSILLVAHGQLWVADGTGARLRYESFMKSLPVEAGESVIFFPLGVAVDADTNIYTIELEIQLVPYENDEQSQQPEE